MQDQTIVSQHHGDTLLAYFQSLHNAQRFTDVIIQCSGVVIDCCHRLILVAFSRHFETVLSGVENSNQITLDIDPKVTGVYYLKCFEIKNIRFIEVNSCMLNFFRKNMHCLNVNWI